MHFGLLGHRIWTRWLARSVDGFLAFFSYYAVPAAIVVFSLLVLFVGPSKYTTPASTTVSFSAVADPTRELTASTAAQKLAHAPSVPYLDTHLKEFPFWFRFTRSAESNLHNPILEFPSRHAQRLTCWDGDTLVPLGHGDRYNVTGAMTRAKAGFALYADALGGTRNVLCSSEYSGPARILVSQWSQADFDLNVQAFHHSIGLLEGGLITLAIFILMTAIINRESRYILFAVWLLGNLRLGAISMGWDTQWLEREIAPQWMPLLRQVTIAAYYVVTFTLFSQFFKSDLHQIGYGWLLRFGQRCGLVLLVLAWVLPFALFLPAMWVVVVIGIAVIIFLLVRIIALTRSRIALWYSAALAMVLFSSFSEVIAAAFDFKLLVGSLNSVTAALASSLLAAFAFAEQMRAEKHERMQAQAELKRTYEVTPVGLFTLETDGRFVRVNAAMQRKFGLAQDRLNTLNWKDYFEESAWPNVLALVARRNGGEVEICDRPVAHRPPRWFLVKVTGAQERIEGSIQDITERVNATERLRFLAHHDSLTGVLNRRGIETVFENEILELTTNKHLALAYLDLDRFKLINDLYGHQTGDEVLKQVCQRIERLLTPGQAFGRIGGDEFIIVMHATPLLQATALSRKIVEAVCDQPFHLGSRAFQVKVSIGLIEVTPSMPARDAISAADAACRHAKQGAQGHLVIYEKDASVFLERVEALALIKELGSTFSPTGLFLLMQPIMSLQNPYGSLNFEVLLRMRDHAGNIVPPSKVVAAAEANGNIAELDKWVLTSTLQWLSEHAGKLNSTQFVCVNLSGASLNDEAFVEDLFQILVRFQQVVPLLCIELTESVALHDLENSRRIIDHLRTLGAKIALDDFGAGYSSFSYLKELAADALKIDGAFVRSINMHPANFAIVEAIVELTRNLGMRSIAEWVEDYATLEALAEMGVDYVQGFVVAYPLAPEKILAAKSAAEFVRDPQVLSFIRARALLLDPPGVTGAMDDTPPPHYH